MMVGLIGAALGFTASFAVISLACDYRYLYFLDLAAVAALLYVALDPPFSRPRRWARRD
jgi:predicted PurR-regulated permease PerM